MQRLLISAFLALSTYAVAAPARITSPDGNVAIAFVLQSGGVPAYKIDYLGQPVVTESRLGLEPDMLEGFTVATTRTDERRGLVPHRPGHRRLDRLAARADGRVGYEAGRLTKRRICDLC